MTPGVKVCGVGDAAIIRLAARLGARYLGFNFFPPSPRFLTPAAAAGLAAGVPAGIERVAVPSIPTMRLWTRCWPPSTSTSSSCTAARRRSGWRRSGRGPRKVMKALKVATAADVAVASAFSPAADLIMFDAKPPEEALLPGGNGVSFDWGLLAGLWCPIGRGPGRRARRGQYRGGDAAGTAAHHRRLERGGEPAGGHDPVLLERFLVAARRLGQDLAVEERQ